MTSPRIRAYSTRGICLEKFHCPTEFFFFPQQQKKTQQMHISDYEILSPLQAITRVLVSYYGHMTDVYNIVQCSMKWSCDSFVKPELPFNGIQDIIQSSVVCCAQSGDDMGGKKKKRKIQSLEKIQNEAQVECHISMPCMESNSCSMTEGQSSSLNAAIIALNLDNFEILDHSNSIPHGDDENGQTSSPCDSVKLVEMRFRFKVHIREALNLAALDNIVEFCTFTCCFHPWVMCANTPLCSSTFRSVLFDCSERRQRLTHIFLHLRNI